MTMLLWLLSRRSAGLAAMLRRELTEARRIVPPLVLLLAISATARGQCGPMGCPYPGPPLQGGWRGSAPPPRRPQPPPVDQGRSVEACEAVVLVRLRYGSDEAGCTGSHLGNGWILTCAHGLRGQATVSVRWSDGAEDAADIVAVDAANDAMLLRTQPTKRPFLRLAKSLQGHRVAHWYGFPGGGGPRAGTVQVLRVRGNRMMFRGSCPMGVSGGPIYVGGDLLAIVSEEVSANGQPWTMNGPHAEWLRDWIDQYRPKDAPVIDRDGTPPQSAGGRTLAGSPEPECETEIIDGGPLVKIELPKPKPKPEEAAEQDMLESDLAGGGGVAGTGESDQHSWPDPPFQPRESERGGDALDALIRLLLGLGLPAAGITGGGVTAAWVAWKAARGVVRWRRSKHRGAATELPLGEAHRSEARMSLADAHTSEANKPVAKEEAGPNVDFPQNPPRDTTEAKQLLRLARLEGRDPLHDALFGTFAADELSAIIEGGGPNAPFATELYNRLERRFNETVPLKLTPTVSED